MTRSRKYLLRLSALTASTGVCSFLSTSAHEKAISPLTCGFSAIVLGHVICCAE
jgi:hypothetical protein